MTLFVADSGEEVAGRAGFHQGESMKLSSRAVSVVAAAVVAVLLVPSAESAPVKPNGTCSVLGKTTKVGKQQFVCKQVAGKRVWKAALKPSPARPSSAVPSASKSPTSSAQTVMYEAPSMPSEVIKRCEVPESNETRIKYGVDIINPTGFPRNPMMLHRTGTMRVALIPIDWADLPGEPAPLTRVNTDIAMFKEWYETVSSGKLKIEWQIQESWLRVSGESKDWAINASRLSNVPRMAEFGRRAIRDVDPYVDFTNVDAVVFVLPAAQQIMGEGAQIFPRELEGGGYRSAEGLVRHYSVAGEFFDQLGRDYWSYWAHEAGHFLLIPHVGSSYVWSDMHGFDLMGAQDGPFRTLNAWLRFMRGWLDDAQIYCRDRETLERTTLTLTPLDANSDRIKAVVVRVNAAQAVIIESRRKTKFDCDVTGHAQGVLVYSYDARFADQQEYLDPIAPVGRGLVRTSCPAERVPDAFLQPGDTVDAFGVQVTVLASGEYDRIRIDRA